METIKPLNPQVAEQFECRFTKDVTVRIPGVWSGKISKITPEAAEALSQSGNKHFTKKAARSLAEKVKPAPAQ